MKIHLLPLLLLFSCQKENATVKESLTTEVLSTTAAITTLNAPVLWIDSANEVTQKVYLRWTKPAGALGYKIYIRYANTSTWYERYTVTDTSYAYGGLPLNEYYDFYVAAYDAVGNYAPSNVVRQQQLYFPPTVTCTLTGKVKGVTYYLNWTTTISPYYFYVKYSQVQYYQGGNWNDIYTQYNSSLSGSYTITLAKKMEVPWRILIMTNYGTWVLSNVVTLKS